MVEDEAAVRDGVARALSRAGFVVTGFADGHGVDAIAASAPDLVVLDVGLPGLDGFALARRLRAVRDVPIVFLTARDAVEDRLTGFSLGADDYLVKPFALEELLARVRAVMRRAGTLTTAVEVGDRPLDDAAAVATRAGRPLELTATESPRAVVPRSSPWPGHVQGPDHDPGLGVRRVRPEPRRGARLVAATQARGARSSPDRDGSGVGLPARTRMNAGPLRRRVLVVVFGVLVLVLAGSIATTTVLFSRALDGDLRHRLETAARALQVGPAGGAAKLLKPSLALEGIDVEVFDHPDVKPIGAAMVLEHRGSLLVIHERLRSGLYATVAASTSSNRRSVIRLLVVELLVGAGALVLAGVVLFRGTRRALAPLDHVASVAERIAAGETDERLRPTRRDTESRRMAEAFDRMVDALAEAVERARHAEDGMRRFLADASHELRSPIAALQASAETLLREQPPRPDRDDLEARLAGDAARLGRLVDDLLSLARVDGVPRPPDDRIAVSLLAARAADQVVGSGHEVAVDVVSDGEVRGDAEALVRALRNVLDNACAADPAGHCAVGVRRVNGTVELRVTDRGAGVPAADRERIFERFVRVDSSRAGTAGARDRAHDRPSARRRACL